jgi:hypothetical protein
MIVLIDHPKMFVSSHSKLFRSFNTFTLVPLLSVPLVPLLTVPLVPLLQLVRRVRVVDFARRESGRGGAQASRLRGRLGQVGGPRRQVRQPWPGHGRAGPGNGRAGPAPLVGRYGGGGRRR